MYVPSSDPLGIKPAPRGRIPIISLGFAVGILVLIPLIAYYAPMIFDRYGPLHQYRSDTAGVALTYPARWQEYEQSFPGPASPSDVHMRLVISPSKTGNPMRGVEIWTYASEASYLTELNSGRQSPYPSLSAYLAESKTAGEASVAGNRHSAIPVEGVAYDALCFDIPGPVRFHVVCADGALSPGELTPPQRLVLERMELF